MEKDERYDITPTDLLQRKVKPKLSKDAKNCPPSIEAYLTKLFLEGDYIKFNRVVGEFRFKFYISLIPEKNTVVKNKEIHFFNFDGVLLKNFIFDNCILWNLTFRQGFFENVVFNRCVLYGLDFSLTKLTKIKFLECATFWLNCTDANLIRSIWQDCLLHGNKFVYADMSLAEIKNSILHGCNLTKAKILRTIMENCTIYYPFLHKTKIENSNFSKSTITSASTFETFFVDCDFTDAKILTPLEIRIVSNTNKKSIGGSK